MATDACDVMTAMHGAGAATSAAAVHVVLAGAVEAGRGPVGVGHGNLRTRMRLSLRAERLYVGHEAQSQRVLNVHSFAADL